MNYSNITVPDTKDVYLGASYTISSLSVMTANGIIAYVIIKSEELHVTAMWMLTFRATVDFLFGFYYLVFSAPSAFLGHFAYPKRIIGFASCVSTLLTGQTIFNIALTVIDRCIAVKRPLTYARIVTKKTFFAAILCSIIINFVRLILIVLPDVDYYYNADIALCVADFDTLVTVIASLGVTLITLIAIVVCSCVIAVEIRRGRRRVNPAGFVTSNDNNSKFPVMVLISVGVFCLSYVPFVVSVIWNLVAKKENIPIYLLKLTTVALLSNSLWNVFIYTATYQPFRDALTRNLCYYYYRQHRREAMVK